MTSEMIFQYNACSRGRYGEEHEYDVKILSDFSDPTVWPYRVTVERITESDFLGSDDESDIERESYRIQKACFEQIKSVIESSKKLQECKSEIDNEVYDGTSDLFYFACDSFKKQITGQSILGSAWGEEELPDYKRSDNYRVKEVYDAIKNILDAQNIDVL